MIPVDPAPEPSGFDENVRSKGRDWIARQGQRVITEFPSYWRWCEPQLHEAFRGRCGWAAMTITSGQIDHFVVSQAECKREQPERAYRGTPGRERQRSLTDSGLSRLGSRP